MTWVSILLFSLQLKKCRRFISLENFCSASLAVSSGEVDLSVASVQCMSTVWCADHFAHFYLLGVWPQQTGIVLWHWLQRSNVVQSNWRIEPCLWRKMNITWISTVSAALSHQQQGMQNFKMHLLTSKDFCWGVCTSHVYRMFLIFLLTVKKTKPLHI